MATTNYQFPTITSEDTINGVTAINGLAEAVDTALGGVIVGVGLNVAANGTLSVNTSWLVSQINNAVKTYMASNYQTGTTWGALNAGGFIQAKEA